MLEGRGVFCRIPLEVSGVLTEPNIRQNDEWPKKLKIHPPKERLYPVWPCAMNAHERIAI